MIDNDKHIHLQNVPDGAEEGKDFFVNFKEKLEKVQTFPGLYTFKFIVKNEAEKLEELRAVFLNEELETKQSQTGKYLSVTIQKEVAYADEVVYYYKKAGKIKDVMML